MLHQELLPDGLHPAVEGQKLVARCLLPLLDELMPGNATASGSPDVHSFQLLD
jgi:hypothetical protein